MSKEPSFKRRSLAQFGHGGRELGDSRGAQRRAAAQSGLSCAPEPALRTLVEVLEERAAAEADRLAFATAGEPIRYGELLQAARSLAGGLERLGLRSGARCALVLDTGLDFLQSFFAVQWLGATPLAMNPALPAELLAARARRHGCELALVEPRLASGWPGAVAVAAVRAAGAPPRRIPAPAAHDPASCAYLQLTSGTTGEPLAAVVSQRALMAYLRMSAARLELNREDVFASWVPLHHDLGLVRFVCAPLLAGAPCHLSAPSLANLRAWLELLTSERATITAAPDFGYRVAARLVPPEGIDLRALRHATSGGEPVRLSTIEAFEARFRVPGLIRPGYGLAEATLGVSVLGAGEPLLALPSGHVGCGPPHDALLVSIACEDAAADGVGEICVRGPSLFDGYLDDPGATAAALREGVLHTGDVGCLRDGQLFVLGRRRAMIKRAGALIAPREAEEAVDGVPGVRISAAIGLAFGGGAEDLVIVAEARTPAGPELRSAIEAAVERALGFTPARVWLLPPRAIPRTPNGKIRYLELRRLAADALGAGTERA